MAISIYWLDDEYEDIAESVCQIVIEFLADNELSGLHSASDGSGRRKASWVIDGPSDMQLNLTFLFSDYETWRREFNAENFEHCVFICDLYCLPGSNTVPKTHDHPVRLVKELSDARVILCTMAFGEHVRRMCEDQGIERWSQAKLHSVLPPLLNELLVWPISSSKEDALPHR